MTKVERENSPKHWPGWAASRSAFAGLALEAARVLHAETRENVDTEISIPGFERDFASVDEFEENVDQDVWTSADSAQIYLRSGDPLSERLRVSIRVTRFLAGATLSISGGTRRSRNAVEPDLAELVGRYARPVPKVARRQAQLLAAPMTCALVAPFALSALTDALGGTVWLGLAISVVLAAVVWPLVMMRGLRWIGARSQPVEFLPDDGITAWERDWPPVRQNLLIALGVLLPVSSLVVAILK